VDWLSAQKKPRRGSPDDRGRIVRFPASTPQQSLSPKQGWLARLGPGIVTGASDLDPSAVVTATVAGAAFSFSLLWLAVLCVPFLLAVFDVTARVGVETRKGLLDLLRENYGRPLATVVAGLTIIIGMAVIIADLMAVSEGFSMLLNLPRQYFVAPIAFSIWYILIFRDYRRITQALIWLSLPLYVYIPAAILTKPDLSQLLWNTFIPHLTSGAHFVDGVVAIFGSLLTPYILLWQISSRSDPGHEPHHGDAWAATLVSCVLFFSIMVSAASVLHLDRPIDMTTRLAAEALRPAVGGFGFYIFALGIIGSGMVALPVLVASMCYDVAQSLGWRYGLSEHPWEAKRFYVMISGAMVVATVANFTPVNPVKALFWSMILAGILTAPTLIFIWVVTNDRRIVRTTNTKWQNFWVGAAAGGSAAATVAYIWQSLLH
jgi:Mn2+/Fe2+ NRAMP family transporter